MSSQSEDVFGRIQLLQACVDDLVRIIALPALRRGREAPQVLLANLLEALLGMLHLDFAYARLNPVREEAYVDVVRIGTRRDPGVDADEVRKAMAIWSGAGPGLSPRVVPNPIGEGDVRVASVRLGVEGDLGVVVAACGRDDFPTQTEALLLQVAVNQALNGLHETRRFQEQRRAADDLEQRVAERTAQLTLANAELRREIAARKRTEDERQKLASLVENSSDFIGLASLDARLLFVNPAGQRLVGLGGDEHARSKTLFDLVTDEERARLEEIVLPEVMRDSRWDGELCFEQLESGAELPMLQHLFLIRLPGSEQPVALGTIARDITQRKRAEAELVAIKDELATELGAMTRLHEFGSLLLTNTDLPTLLQAALDATIALQRADYGMAQLYDAYKGTFKLVAQRGFRPEFLGLLSEEPDRSTACGRALLGRVRVVIEDVELDEAFEPLREAARAAGFRAVQSTPLFARDGQPFGVISTHFQNPHRPSERDLRLTDLYARQAAAMIERQRTDEALRRSEFYLSEGQKLSQTGSWGLKLDTREVFSSDENLRIFGLDPAAAKPTYEGYFELMHPDDRAMVQRGIDQARAERRDFEAQFRVVWPDKTVRNIHSMARPLFDESGRLIEFVGMNMDITDRKRDEDALRRAHIELAHVNRVMTMGELAASIAHEVNQPLAAVLTSAQACERWLCMVPADIHEARLSAQRIARDALRASDVLARIRGLLSRREPVKTAVRVHDVLREVVSLVQTEARTQQVALRLWSEADLPAVLGDRVQIEQVVLNLVVNAIEAMRGVTGRARELDLRAEREGLEHVRVSVRDSGPGLPEASRERIFDAFYTTKAQGMGMGMGLAISTSIVNAHGGRLWATPNQDAGETFQFTLPIASSIHER
jgi:PAS domain S-box-containing protein